MSAGPAWMLRMHTPFRHMSCILSMQGLHEDGASNAILSPFHELQTKYEAATAEAPRAARNRAGRAGAAARVEVCSVRRNEALASVLNIVGLAEDEEEELGQRKAQRTQSGKHSARRPKDARGKFADALESACPIRRSANDKRPHGAWEADTYPYWGMGGMGTPATLFVKLSFCYFTLFYTTTDATPTAVESYARSQVSLPR